MSTTHIAPPATGRRVPLGWLVAGGAVALVGLLAALAWGLAGAWSSVRSPDGFARLVPPGAVTVTASHGQEQVVYVEGPSGGASLADLGISVRGPDGAAVAVGPYDGTLRYDSDHGLAKSFGTFTSGAPGEYTVAVAGDVPDGSVVAVGDSIATTLFHSLLGPAIVAGAALVLAVILVTVPFARRPQEGASS